MPPKQLLLFTLDRSAEDERDRRAKVFGTPEFRKAYDVYIHSPEWRRKVAALKRRSGGRCEWKGCSNAGTEGHHKHYKTFRDECLEDLLLVCEQCHPEADKAREFNNDFARRRGRYDAFKRRYLTSRLGEDWEEILENDPTYWEGVAVRKWNEKNPDDPQEEPY